MVELKSFPYNSVDDDRVYESKDFRDYFRKFIGNGVYKGSYKDYGESSMLVVAGDGLNVIVTRGAGLINGIDFELEENIEIGLSGDGVYTVVVRIDDTFEERRTLIDVISGTGLTQNEDIYEMALAEVHADGENITVTDKREQMHGELLAPYYPENELPEVLWRYVVFPDACTEEEKYYIENNPQLKELAENSGLAKASATLNNRIDNEGHAKWEREETGVTLGVGLYPAINGYFYSFFGATKVNIETGVVTNIAALPSQTQVGNSRTSQTYDPEKNIIYYMSTKQASSNYTSQLSKYDIETNTHTVLKTFERAASATDYLRTQYDAHRKQLYVEYKPYSGSPTTIKVYDENLNGIYTGAGSMGLESYFVNGCTIQVRHSVLKKLNNSADFTQAVLYHRSSEDPSYETLFNIEAYSDRYTYFLKGSYAVATDTETFLAQGLLIYDQELSKYKFLNIQNVTGSPGVFFIKDGYVYMTSINCRYRIKIDLGGDWIDVPLGNI